MTLTSGAFSWVRDVVRRDSAIVLDGSKEYLVEARLTPLARNAGAADVSAYVDSIRASSDPRAREDVVAALTTNETSWFRDITPFRALSEHLVPEILKRRRTNRTLRIWSAACSSGQEPYSLVMSLGPMVRAAGWQLEIQATDINQAMVERAARGYYSQLEVNRGLPVTMLLDNFVRDGAGWVIAPEIRRAVTVSRMNLASPVMPAAMRTPFDIVLLRNVLIYFDATTKRDILGRVRSVVHSDGYLVLGSAETTLGVDDTWDRHVVAGAPIHHPVLVAQRKGA